MMFDIDEINKAIQHAEHFETGEFTDAEVLLLYRYYLHLLTITSRVKGLECISLYACVHYRTYQDILRARGLEVLQ